MVVIEIIGFEENVPNKPLDFQMYSRSNLVELIFNYKLSEAN